MTDGKKTTLFFDRERKQKVVEGEDGSLDVSGKNFNAHVTEEKIHVNVDVITSIKVDTYMRETFDEFRDGNIVSGSYSFSDGGHGEYAYEVGGKLVKFIGTQCKLHISNDGAVTISAQSRPD